MAEIKYNIITDDKGSVKKIDKVGAAFDKSGKKADMAGTKAKSLGGVLGGLKGSYFAVTAAVGGMAAGVAAAIGAHDEQVAAINALNQALGNQGNLLPGTSSRLQEYASALQAASIFGDEAILKAQTQLAAFGANEEQIRQLSGVTLDYAAATGKDLNTAFLDVGKAFAGQSSQLSRLGVDYASAGSETERLETITGSLASMFGGQAALQTEGITGKLAQLKNSAGDTLEQFGKFISFLTGQFGGGVDFAIGSLEALGRFFGEILPTVVSEARAQLAGMDAALFSFQASLNKVIGAALNSDEAFDRALNFEKMAQESRDLAVSIRESADEFVRTSGAIEPYNAKVAMATGVTTSLTTEVGEASSALVTMRSRFTELQAINPQIAIPNEAASKYAGLMDVIPTAQAGFTEEVVETAAQTGTWRDVLGETSSAMSALGISSDSTLGKILGGAQRVLGALDSVFGVVKSITGAFSGGGGLFGGGGGGGGLGGILGGLAGIIPGGGLIGAAVGGVGALVGGIAGLFGGGPDIQRDVKRDIGPSISKGLADAIEESSLPVQAAIGAIFREGFASGDSAATADRLAEEIGDVFSSLERGELSKPAAITAIEGALPLLIERFDELGAVGVENLERIAGAAEHFGVDFRGLEDVRGALGAPAPAPEAGQSQAEIASNRMQDRIASRGPAHADTIASNRLQDLLASNQRGPTEITVTVPLESHVTLPPGADSEQANRIIRIIENNTEEALRRIARKLKPELGLG